MQYIVTPTGLSLLGLSSFEGTAEDCIELLVKQGVIQTLCTGTDKDVTPPKSTESVTTDDVSNDDVPTVPKTFDQVVKFDVQKRTIMGKPVFGIVTTVDGKVTRDMEYPMKLGENGFKQNLRGCIPYTMRFIIELLQNAIDANGIGPSIGMFGDGMVVLTTTLTHKGFGISYSVKKCRDRRVRVSVTRKGNSMVTENTSPFAINENAWIAGQSSKPNRRGLPPTPLDILQKQRAAMFSPEGWPTSYLHMYTTSVEVTPPPGFNDWDWYHALLCKSHPEDKCFLKWDTCMLLYRFHEAMRPGTPHVFIYHGGMLLFADVLPLGESDLIIQIISNEQDRMPTKGRDRHLTTGWLRRCVPKYIGSCKINSQGLDELIPFLLKVLEASQDKLDPLHLLWVEEVLDLLAKTRKLHKTHFTKGLCVLNAHQQVDTDGLDTEGCQYIQTYSTSVAKMCSKEAYFLDYCIRKSNEDTSATKTFCTDAMMPTKTANDTIGISITHTMHVRRFTEPRNVRIFSSFYEKEKSVTVRYPYIWHKASKTMFIPHNWSKTIITPLQVMSYFGLVKISIVYKEFDRLLNTSVSQPNADVKNVSVSNIRLDGLTRQDRSNQAFPTKGPECMAVKVTSVAENGTIQICETGTVFVGKRMPLSHPDVVSALTRAFLSSCSIVPSTMQGVFDNAIPKRYASILGIDMDKPLSFQMKMQILVLLMMELTARPYGSDYWSVLKVFDVLPANCNVKSQLCLEILQWVGIHAYRIMWTQFNHALVGFDVDGVAYTIETTAPPLPLNAVYARNRITKLGYKQDVHFNTWFRKLLKQDSIVFHQLTEPCCKWIECSSTNGTKSKRTTKGSRKRTHEEMQSESTPIKVNGHNLKLLVEKCNALAQEKLKKSKQE